MIAQRSDAPDTRDPILEALPPHLVVPELHHPVPDLGLGPSCKQDVDLVEAELAVDKDLVLLLRPIVLVNNEAWRIRSRRRQRGRLEEVC